jgi:hypothetical protein
VEQEQEFRFYRASERLKNLARFWAQRLAFDQVALLLEQFSGKEAPSADTIWSWVHQQAEQVDEYLRQQIQHDLALPSPKYVACVDPYEAEFEFLVMSDGIGVKSQKPTRERRGEARKAKRAKRHDTDVMIVPRLGGGEHLLCEGVSERWSVVEATRAYLNAHYGTQTLCVVALTDGARSIREDLAAIFGGGVRVILDWYHLSKRVYQQLSMAAHGKKERESWESCVLSWLWRGKVSDALAFLSGLTARNRSALDDLLGYLEKHRDEILDYERRQECGKPIGSGRMEKAVDQVVGHRQKGKGMSWTRGGSRALALLTCQELNARQPGRS